MGLLCSTPCPPTATLPFLFFNSGKALLVHPVTEQAATEVGVLLPGSDEVRISKNLQSLVFSSEEIIYFHFSVTVTHHTVAMTYSYLIFSEVLFSKPLSPIFLLVPQQPLCFLYLPIPDWYINLQPLPNLNHFSRCTLSVTSVQEIS